MPLFVVCQLDGSFWWKKSVKSLGSTQTEQSAKIRTLSPVNNYK